MRDWRPTPQICGLNPYEIRARQATPIRGHCRPNGQMRPGSIRKRRGVGPTLSHPASTVMLNQHARTMGWRLIFHAHRTSSARTKRRLFNHEAVVGPRMSREGHLQNREISPDSRCSGCRQSYARRLNTPLYSRALRPLIAGAASKRGCRQFLGRGKAHHALRAPPVGPRVISRVPLICRVQATI